MFGILPLLFLTPSVILILAAVIPAVALIVYVYRMDRLEKESWGLIWKLILFGIISTLGAQFTESVGIKLLRLFLPEGGRAYNIILYFVVVALSEEGFKYLVLKWKTWYSPEFNCRFDGVVYATTVSLGFALWENINYVISYGFGTALVRAVTAVPGHACFGVFMGAFYGSAKRFENAGDRINSGESRTLALIVPILLHGAYDYIASSGKPGATLVFLGFIAAMFYVSYRTVKKLSATDRYI